MWIWTYVKFIFVLIPPQRAEKCYIGREDVWIGWERNSFSFYDATTYRLYLAFASICCDYLYPNVQGKAC